MLDRQMLIDGRLRRRLVQICEEDHPVAAQIMGNDPAVMAQAAKVLCEMGFDVIDLNFACPVKKVLGRCRGGFLLSDPETALQIVGPVRKVISRRRGGHMMRQPSLTIEITRAVLDAVRDRPVTLKLRRAYLESDATYEAFWHIAQAAFDAGAAALCVHARSVEQKYMGQADWGFLAAVKRAFPARTIIGSGDVHTAADALKMIEMTGVDGVAAARGAIGNPWLFRQARDLAAGRQPHRPDIAEQRDVLLRHFEMTCQLYGPRRGPKIMRKFGIKYARVHPTPAKVRNAFVEIKSHADWQAVLDQYY
jgi:tRNA-dihydrouridine synthase